MTDPITTADRDHLALVALSRLSTIERRVLGMLYGLKTERPDSGVALDESEIRKQLSMSETRFKAKLESALGKVAAVIDVQPIIAGRVLFRIATLQGEGRLPAAQPPAKAKEPIQQ